MRGGFLAGSQRANTAEPGIASESSCLEGYERELDYLFVTLRRLGARGSDVEDLAQEVFLVLNRKWPRFDTTRPLRPYLFGIAFRIVRAHLRQLREIPFADLAVEDQAPGPEETLKTKQSRALLKAAMERIPLKRRAVVIMHDLDEFSVSDIAARLSLSIFGIYARLRKGRKELTTAVRRLSSEHT